MDFVKEEKIDVETLKILYDEGFLNRDGKDLLIKLLRDRKTDAHA